MDKSYYQQYVHDKDSREADSPSQAPGLLFFHTAAFTLALDK
jgi:hypothetical protein